MNDQFIQWELKQNSNEVKLAKCRTYSKSIVKEMKGDISRSGRRFMKEDLDSKSYKVQERQMRRILEKKMAQAAHKAISGEWADGRLGHRLVDFFSGKCYTSVMSV